MWEEDQEEEGEEEVSEPEYDYLAPANAADEPTELEIRRPAEVVLPSGEIIDLSDPDACAKALVVVREQEQHLREVKSWITDVFAEEALRRGENVVPLSDGTSVTVKKNYETTWDAEQLEEDLRAAGMPEDRIAQIIVQEVTHTVKAVEANKAKKANPAYAEAIERARSQTDKKPTISLPRG